MNKRILGIICFLAMLALYITLLRALARVLPEICLIALVVWGIVRRPLKYPERMEEDMEALSTKAAKGIKVLLGILFRPLKGF
jgi:hypothetical protein